MAKWGSLFLPADRPSNTPWNRFSSRKNIMVKGEVPERFASQKWAVIQLTGKEENFFGFWKSTACIACTWISMLKHMKQCHFLGSHSLDDFPSKSNISTFSSLSNAKAVSFHHWTEGKQQMLFSTASIKQMLMEDEKTFDVKACPGSSPSPHQLILANWK